MLGDPDHLDRLATELRSQAEQVRTVATDHVRAGQAAHWVSSAATEHRDQIWSDRTAAHAAADEMDEAARLIGIHADAVRDRLAAIAAAAAAALELARETADDVRHGVEVAVDVVGDVAEEAGDTALTVLTAGLYQGRD